MYVGGYLENTLPLVIESEGTAVPSRRVLDAVHRLQGVQWQVHAELAQLLADSLARGDQLGGLPAVENTPLPEPADWDALSDDDRNALMLDRAAVHTANAERRRKFMLAHTIKRLAQKFQAEPAIYYPHQSDFRGRLYPAPTDLNPQASKLALGMLRFAEPKKLTSEGERWLAIGLANAAGKDKLPLEDRAAWTRQHRELIIDSARDPVDGERFWCDAEEPWVFLALAKDLAACITQTPVRLDCTCSGIQHLAALTRDAEIADAVNLTPGSRRDLYQVVADKVAGKVSTLALQGESHAAAWAGRITRATMKQPTFTLAYGATRNGRQQQLLPFALELGVAGAHARASWLAKAAEEVLHGQLPGPMQALAYFNGIAKAISRANRPVRWTTPSGLQVSQHYLLSDEKRVRTVAGQLSYRQYNPERPAVRKSSQSTAPNVIHSLDAAHMTAVLLAFDGPMAAIHDSFGTYANDVGRLAAVVRENFSEIYSSLSCRTGTSNSSSSTQTLSRSFPIRPGWAPGTHDRYWCRTTSSHRRLPCARSSTHAAAHRSKTPTTRSPPVPKPSRLAAGPSLASTRTRECRGCRSRARRWTRC